MIDLYLLLFTSSHFDNEEADMALTCNLLSTVTQKFVNGG